MKNKFAQAGIQVTSSAREEFSSDVAVWDISGETDGTTTIKWFFEMEVRNYGIKSFYLIVPDQEITIDWEKKSQEKLEIKDVEAEFMVDGEFTGITLIPKTLEHSSGKWTLKF